MAEWKKIEADQFNESPFRMIGKEWMLVTAEKDGKVNAMTASWGGMGVMWGKNVAFVVIRPTRYTKEFIDASETFSLAFLPEKYRKQLSYFGTVSGRDEDKIQKVQFSVSHEGAKMCIRDSHEQQAQKYDTYNSFHIAYFTKKTEKMQIGFQFPRFPV